MMAPIRHHPALGAAPTLMRHSLLTHRRRTDLKWITSDHVHLDRVASPWLILRFVDEHAAFEFVPFGAPIVLPDDAIPFGLAGVELGAHDADGSTFRKIMRKYKLETPALEMLADIVESGIAYALAHMGHDHTPSSKSTLREGAGLDAISQGMMYIAADDIDDIMRSLVIYDALHAFCRAKLLDAERPEIRATPFPERWNIIKAELLANS